MTEIHVFRAEGDADLQRSIDVYNAVHPGDPMTIIFGRDVLVAEMLTRFASERFVAPTITVEPRPDSSIMRDEIFGPILPIVEVDSMEEALEWLKRAPFDALCSLR